MIRYAANASLLESNFRLLADSCLHLGKNLAQISECRIAELRLCHASFRVGSPVQGTVSSALIQCQRRGQTRKSALVTAMSAFPPLETKLRASREVRFVPGTGVGRSFDHLVGAVDLESRLACLLARIAQHFGGWETFGGLICENAC